MKRILLWYVLLFGVLYLNGQEISISGNKFTLGEKEIWFNGINTPWHLFDDFGRTDFTPSWWSDEFARYKENHINLARVWIHGSGEISPDIDETGYVSGASDLFWQHMDYLMEVAEANQVYVLPALLSFDITKNTYTTYQSWRAFVQSESNVQSYIDNVLIPLVKRYNDRPYLLGWEICNEPEWMFENPEHGPQSFYDIQRLHAMFAAAVHENCTKPVTTGSAAPKWNSPVYDSWGEYEGNMFSDEALSTSVNNPEAYLDFYQYHWYPWQTEWLDSPFTKSTVFYQVDDRPVIVGESEGNNVCDLYICQTVSEMYESAYINGFDGVCAWKTPQNDGHGTFENIAVATNTFFANHPLLVYPDNYEPVPVEGISLSEVTISIEERQTFQLSAILIPANATDKRISWSSSDTDVATIANGLVTGIASGYATVSVTTYDGNFIASCEVEVTPHGIICSDPVIINPPFSQSGAGTYCWVTSGTIDYINSWGMDLLEINGEDFTNTYSAAIPARIDGNYYIYYVGSQPWAHMEITGSGGTVTEYSLTVNTIGSGDVTPESGIYTEGTNVTLTATPANGYQFSGWSGDASGTSLTTGIIMDNDKTVTATFIPVINPDQYALTVIVIGMGNVIPDGGIFDEGTNVTLAAIPDTGYRFVDWSGDVNETSSSVNIMMNSDKIVTATFEEVGVEPCNNPEVISVPYTQNGAGEFCWVTSDDIAYVNSWNLEMLEINGVDYTNTWSGNLPAKINGNYYIHYIGNYSWSHFDAAALKSQQNKEPFTNIDVSAYPNPFSESILLNVKKPEIISHIYVCDNLGRVIKSIDKSEITNEIFLGSAMVSGIYYIRIYAENGTQSLCILKE